MGICSKFNTWKTVLLSLLILLFLLSNNAVSKEESLLQQSRRRFLSEETGTGCQPKQNLEYYSIPPFAVQFTTLDVNDIAGMDKTIVISETDAKASSLTYPLKMATQEFLMTHFKEQIGLLREKEKEGLLQAYYQQLTEVELRVVLTHNPRVTNIPGHVALIATMHGTLHFWHTFGCNGETTLVPSQTEVTITFGAWLETILETKRDEYLQRLLSNGQSEMLREIVDLTLIPNYYTSERSQGVSSWLYMIGIVFGIVGLGGLMAACIWLVRGMNHQQQKGGSTDLSNFTISSNLDSKQHGMDISAHRRHTLDVLNKSEEYLVKHRPDLTDHDDSATRRSSFSKNPLENIMSFFDLSSGTGTGSLPEPKINSPPRSGRRSFASRQRSSIELQAGNIAANNQKDPSPLFFDDISLNHESEEAIMMAAASQSSKNYRRRPISNMWRSMTSIFRPGGGSFHHENDGIMMNANNFYFDGAGNNDEEYFRQQFMEEDQRLRDEQWMTFMKEEEKEFTFAFKDFPRKDGTPCLIYNGDGGPSYLNNNNNDAENDIFTVRSSSPNRASLKDGGGGETEMLNEREILSDEAFRQLLNIGASPSFEDTTTTTQESSSSPAKLGYKSPEFNERLSSLFAEKHRQYEKRSIVERHQQKRKKEREMERRERQKDMHRELEALEAGMAMSDKWRAKHHVSPRPYDLSPARQQCYSPNIHNNNMRRSPAPPAATGRSPIPHPPIVSGISNARRSPVPMTSSIPPRHSKTKSLDLDDPFTTTTATDHHHHHHNIQLIRPRMSRPHAAVAAPPSELFVMESTSRYHYSADLDPSSLDKLSMPSMNNSSRAPPPHPMSEMPPRNPHRRVNSTDNLPLHHYNNNHDCYGRNGLETIGAMTTTTPPRRGLSPSARRRRVPSPRPGGGGGTNNNNTRGMSPIRGMSPARISLRMSSSSAARRGTSPSAATTTTTRGRGSVRGLSPKPGPRSTSNSSRHSREGSGVFDHGIAALF